jgi:crotonobetainyl-CoA:carnitine CoA-transferase CaiB-like acyl-CoA transferase
MAMTNRSVFDGLKIAEFAWVIVGPATSRYFAEHGATVVKIESHRRLDTMRGTSPFAGGRPTVDSSMAYGRHNPNKYSVSIDLQAPGGRELAWKLIEWADVVTESFSPGTMEKWGLGYEEVRQKRPDIIYLSSSMQGRGGPHSAYAGYGMNAVNLCGFTGVTGWPDRRPAAPHGAYTDYINTRFNALAIMAALDYRRRTGKGQYIEQSQFETSLHFFAPPVMDYFASGAVMERDGNRSPEACPHGVFPCKGDDEWLALAVTNENEWQNLCIAIGRPDLAARYPALADRQAHEETLERLIAEWTARYSPSEAEAVLRPAGVPCHAVARPKDVYGDAQLASRGYWQELRHPVMGPQKYEPQSSFILSETPRRLTMPSPCLGEHNEQVFKGFLGLTDDEISSRIADGSITTELPGEFKASM